MTDENTLKALDAAASYIHGISMEKEIYEQEILRLLIAKGVIEDLPAYHPIAIALAFSKWVDDEIGEADG